jgi:WD40 repeat protein
VSADGRTAISGGEDNTVRVWDVASGRCLRTLEGHTGYVKPVALSADLRTAISGSEDNTVRVWGIGTLRSNVIVSFELCMPITSGDALEAAGAFRSLLKDAREALAGGDQEGAASSVRQARAIPGRRRNKNAMELWRDISLRVRRGEFIAAWEERTLEGHTNGVNSVSISADGHTAFSGGSDGMVRVWDLANGRCLRSLGPHGRYVVNKVSVSADGRIGLSLAGSGDVWLWDLYSGSVLRSFEDHNSGATSVSMSADGRIALSCKANSAVDNRVKVWDVASGRCLRTLEGHARNAFGCAIVLVAVSADGRIAFSGGYDGTLRVWDVASGRCLRTLEGHAGPLLSLALSADGRAVISGGYDGTLRVWDVASGRCLCTLEGHAGPFLSLALSADGRTVLSGGGDHTVRLWDAAGGRGHRTLEGHTGPVCSVALSADGRTALSGGQEGTIRVWTLDWELLDRSVADWDEGARPYLEVFLSLHTPFAAPLPADRAPSEGELSLALTRRGRPDWSEDNFTHLLFTLGGAGYGWLRTEGVRQKLGQMAARWNGPPAI